MFFMMIKVLKNMLIEMEIMVKKMTRKVFANITLGMVSKSTSEGAKNQQNLGSREYYG